MQEGVFHQQKSWVSGMVMLPGQEQQLRCPRCNSTNTKFCYYNNYNLYQPRHFCKSCRRYWTKGGALRNVPVGGGTRKTNKRSRGHASSSPPISQNKSPNLEMTTGENLSMPMDLSSMYPCPLATSTASLE